MCSQGGLCIGSLASLLFLFDTHTHTQARETEELLRAKEAEACAAKEGVDALLEAKDEEVLQLVRKHGLLLQQVKQLQQGGTVSQQQKAQQQQQQQGQNEQQASASMAMSPVLLPASPHSAHHSQGHSAVTSPAPPSTGAQNQQGSGSLREVHPQVRGLFGVCFDTAGVHPLRLHKCVAILHALTRFDEARERITSI